MTTPARRVEVPPDFARGFMDNSSAAQPPGRRTPELAAVPEDGAQTRTIDVRLLRDLAALTLIVGGAAVGDTVAWLAGGMIPGLATLAGLLIALGLVLGASRSSE